MLELKLLLEAGVHFGHKTSKWSPNMRPFIWGSKNKIHLIDVAKTAFLLERAGNFLKNTAAEGRSILWVGTKKPAQDSIKKVGESLKMPFVINRWIGGTLTNFDQVKKAITRLLHLRDVVSKGTSIYKKKEISMIQKEILRLEKNIGGILDLVYPPAVMVAIDAQKEHSAIKEALNAGIPVVAMVDTNTDPSGINFIIPANDDSPKSINFVLNYLASCVKEGAEIFKTKQKEAATLAEAEKKAKAEELAAKRQQALKAQQEKAAKTHQHPTNNQKTEHKVEHKKDFTKKVAAHTNTPATNTPAKSSLGSAKTSLKKDDIKKESAKK